MKNQVTKPLQKGGFCSWRRTGELAGGIRHEDVARHLHDDVADDARRLLDARHHCAAVRSAPEGPTTMQIKTVVSRRGAGVGLKPNRRAHLAHPSRGTGRRPCLRPLLTRPSASGPATASIAARDSCAASAAGAPATRPRCNACAGRKAVAGDRRWSSLVHPDMLLGAGLSSHSRPWCPARIYLRQTADSRQSMKHARPP